MGLFPNPITIDGYILVIDLERKVILKFEFLGSSLVAQRVESLAFSPLWLWLLLRGVGLIPGPEIPTYCLCGKKEKKKRKQFCL